MVEPGFSVAELWSTYGIVAVQVTGLPMYDDGNGVVSAEITTPTDGIAQ